MAEETTTPVAEEKPPEEAAPQEQEAQKPESPPPMYPVSGSDGKAYEFDQTQIMQLAEMGLNTHLKAQEPEPEPEPEKVEKPTVESLSNKLDKANEDFHNYKADNEKKAQLDRYKVDLETATDNLELVKEYPSQRHNIMTQAAILVGNQKISISDAVAQVSKNLLEFLKEVEANKNHANTKVRAIVDQVQPGGGTPALVLDKPLTADAITSGRSQRDMAALLESFKEK